ncbi:glycoside hydrolase family 105 protein [Dothistroma septosporum NZE10]|uniref:Glycoside hydrolase family 105 protein n=1 Tax=Dothistroma septosporum (strain NZE10 / CBS 128990) TaxID=675120 RepID=N1PN86_DOTSN|nr:glycoside hydrolase family 105 protein [Dothistroma septosporum NZE10]
MLNSNIARGQGIGQSGASTSYIELGIFQQSLLESIAATTNTTQKSLWTSYLHQSLSSTIPSLSNATADAALSLDRFSIGTALILAHNESYATAKQALQDSIPLQPRNANDGLWYYNNLANLSAYHNLSYADGMYSFPSFAIAAANASTPDCDSPNAGGAAALEQISLIYEICKRSNGLVVHGYDASKAHPWADPRTGASPIVWGRALGWFTIGTLRALSLLPPSGTPAFARLEEIFNEVMRAQVEAGERSLAVTGSYGVWQVLEQPDAEENFVEASASAMTVYALLKGVRTGLVGDKAVRERAVEMGMGIYRTLMREFVIENGNGTLSYNGTSSVASLSGDVSFEYYVTRPTVLNSLIGSSAFILAALEVEKVC